MTEIKLFNTPEHECAYLPDELSITQFVNPDEDFDIGLYTFLSQHGFRRSGDHIYRPKCPSCNACKAIRVAVDEFIPSKGQKRCINRAGKFKVQIRPAQFYDNHYQIYEQYIANRHQDGEMYPPTEELYKRFLLCDWSRTNFLEVMDGEKLIACAVFDHLFDGLSAVYSYFDTDYDKYSLGKLLVMVQIEHAKSLKLPYLYLGFQIDECQKMNYKTQYQPSEQLIDNKWQRI